MSKKKCFAANIKGHDWKFYSQSKTSYSRAHGSDSEGITYPRVKEVYFNDFYLTPAIVRHELMHCFVASSSTASSNLSADQIEELCCSIVEEHGPEIDLLADKITTFFKGK